MNVDEAERCCDIARAALDNASSEADLEKALRFISKALKLDSTSARANKLRADVESKRVKGFSGSASASASENGRNGEANGRSASQPGTQRRASATTSAPSGEKSAKRGTPEQEKLIANVKKAGADYYRVLGIERGASDADIKKAYRKLALKLHPDKCQAAGAEEVFKTVSKAFACLSDPNKRAAFDRYGSDDPQQAGFGPGMRRRGGAGGAQGFGFDDDIDPADIFNMFFNGGMPGGMGGFGGPGFRVHTFGGGFPRQRQHSGGARGPHVDDSATVIRNILHLLPLLIPILMWLLTPAEEHFSMHRSKEHPHLLRTSRMELPFYVNKHVFEQKFPKGDQQRSMEDRIENEIINRYRRQCDYERQSWTSKRPHCEHLRELQKNNPELNVFSPWR